MLQSSPSLSELFYLCKVLEFETSSTVQNDKYNHTMPVGASFIKHQYLERLEEKKRKLFYKLLPDVVFVFPAEVMSKLVPLNKCLSLPSSDYQWHCDMI